jgi:Na+-transporting NADH:ubiquinone oxidoreductase subunit A
MLNLDFSGGLCDNFTGRPERSLLEQPEIPATLSVGGLELKDLKPLVKIDPGQSLKAGEILFESKRFPEVVGVAPFDCKVKDVIRGYRRVLVDIILEPDAGSVGKKVHEPISQDCSVEELKKHLLETGMWPFFREYPYNVVANPKKTPKTIVVTCGGKEPYTPEPAAFLGKDKELIVKGMELLHKLSGDKLLVSDELEVYLTEKEKRYSRFYHAGEKYPSGNPAVAVYYFSPLKENEVFWYVDIQDLIAMAHLVSTGSYRIERLLTVAGPGVKNPRYVAGFQGMPVSSLAKELSFDEVCYISGGLFTGTRIEKEGYLGFYHHSLHVLPLGNEQTFLRFMRPGFGQHSTHRSVVTSFLPAQSFTLSDSLCGEKRSCIACGSCEKVCPVGLLPQFLFKAAVIEDLDTAEELCVQDCVKCGLCSYVCPSKIELTGIFHETHEKLLKEEEAE